MQLDTDPSANCHCTAANEPGLLDVGTGGLTLSTREGHITALSWRLDFASVTRICTPASVDCQNVTAPEASVWLLAGMNPACSRSSQLTFTNPRELIGNWSLTCPANPSLEGRVEEATWTLTGAD